MGVVTWIILPPPLDVIIKSVGNALYNNKAITKVVMIW
jgi:hypothetical protein